MAVATAVAGWPGMAIGAERPRPVVRAEPEEVSLDRSVEAAGARVRVPDDELVARLVPQDAEAEAALGELYDRYSGAVYGLAIRMLSDAAVAEEVLQETFWRLWRFAGRYEPGRVRFVTWLLRVATNLAISEQRRRGRRPRTSPLAPPQTLGCEGEEHAPVDVADPDPDVSDQVWRAERQRAVSAGLATLPAVQRQAVELAYFGGLTHAEIAATQGAPLSTVKTRLALGLRKLADFLNGQGVTRLDCLG